MSIKLKPGIVADVPVSQLERDPNQPRQTFDNDSLKELGESLALRVEVPLKVRQEGGRTIIVDGERRWRAAKLKKLKSLPCLLASFENTVDIGVSQLTTSAQRESLSPLDIGEYLVDLQKREKRSMNELMATLAKRGIVEIGQAKLDKYMRLVELPDWAKDYIREGTFTEAHGSALLPVIKFEPVLKEIKAAVARNIQWKGGITVKELVEDVDGGIRSVGIDLNQTWGKPEDIRQFPITICKGCEFFKTTGRGGNYCLNKKEFRKKQDEALLLKAEKEARKAEAQKKNGTGPRDETDPTQVEPKTFKASKQDIVILKGLKHGTHRSLEHVDFDKTPCAKCPHRHAASYDGTKTAAGGVEDHCFHIPCFDNLTRLDTRAQGRKDKMREYLEAWLRPTVARIAPIRFTQEQTYGIALWLMTGATEQYSNHYGGQMHQKAAEHMGKFLGKHNIRNLPAIMGFAKVTFGEEHWKELVRLSVGVLTRDQLRWMAQAIDINLSEPLTLFRIDEGYLKLKRKSELQDLAKIAGLETVAGLGVGDLQKALLTDDSKEKIAVPADIEQLYRESFEAPPPDDEDDDFDLDDDEDGADLLIEEGEDEDELPTAGVAAAINQSEDKRKKRKRAGAPS